MFKVWITETRLRNAGRRAIVRFYAKSFSFVCNSQLQSFILSNDKSWLSLWGDLCTFHQVKCQCYNDFIYQPLNEIASSVFVTVSSNDNKSMLFRVRERERVYFSNCFISCTFWHFLHEFRLDICMRFVKWMYDCFCSWYRIAMVSWKCHRSQRPLWYDSFDGCELCTLWVHRINVQNTQWTELNFHTVCWHLSLWPVIVVTFHRLVQYFRKTNQFNIQRFSCNDMSPFISSKTVKNQSPKIASICVCVCVLKLKPTVKIKWIQKRSSGSEADRNVCQHANRNCIEWQLKHMRSQRNPPHKLEALVKWLWLQWSFEGSLHSSW